ncbi:superoxide dismutase [Ferruginivarius sediminum]|uniref:Superoxide dismutase n=1 Tax=Ferruginivarius sediminum TaxID=2661937 RepID=A0A369T7Z6_9PROT|nr:superoxide dismutase [Ferruginivarius sediminum]RDD61430.1 superoxide dismutase [Ferruginivarius sediminum]
MAFELPDLPYAYDALDPYMSAETLEYHHDKHHNAYVTTLNGLIEGTDLAGKSLEDIVRETYNDSNRTKIFNQASQAWNHNQFWPWMKKGGGKEQMGLPGELEKAINDAFGGWDQFRDAFVTAAAGQFGSGWAWLVQENGQLKVTATPNGVNPLCFSGQTALLGCDVWEHSYYLDYRNRRPDYVKAFLDNMVDWENVAGRMKG